MFPFFLCPKSRLRTLADSGEDLSVRDVTAALRPTDPANKHRLWVAQLTNGKVMGQLKLALTRTNQAVEGVQVLADESNPETHPVLRRLRLRVKRRHCGRALLLATREAENYYHWMLDCLPRWKLMAAAGFKEYDHVLLNTGSRSRPFNREILDLLGVPAHKRLHCSKSFLYEFDELVVPAMPFPKWEVAAWACAWTGSLFRGQSAGSPERIYISRRGAKNRPLLNEAELEAQLVARSFVTVQPERLSVAEQSVLFRRARCVVGPHGAGLTNLIFSPKTTHLIELKAREYQTPPCYQNLATARGLPYSCITGPAGKNQEFTINIPEVLKMV